MEELVALCLLWAFDLGTKEDYCALLDGMFLDNPNDEFLFDLENLTSDVQATLVRLRDLDFLDGEFDVDDFGGELFSGLEKFWDSGVVSLKEFGERCYDLWQQLPWEIASEVPFQWLCCAVDEYDFSVAHQREFLQTVFGYYKEKI